MKRFISLGLGIILISCMISACSKSGNNNTANPSSNSVSIKDMQFTPSSITVNAGATVTWTNNDNTTHTVTSTTGVFNSGNLDASKTYSFTFTTKGTYPYTCTIHPSMTGTVIVN